MGSYPKPPPAPRFEHSPETLLKDTHNVIDTSRKLQDDIAAKITPDTASFDNVIGPLAESENLSGLETAILGFYQYVSADKAVRDASSESEKLLDVSADIALENRNPLPCNWGMAHHSIAPLGLWY